MLKLKQRFERTLKRVLSMCSIQEMYLIRSVTDYIILDLEVPDAKSWFCCVWRVSTSAMFKDRALNSHAQPFPAQMEPLCTRLIKLLSHANE